MGKMGAGGEDVSKKYPIPEIVGCMLEAPASTAPSIVC